MIQQTSLDAYQEAIVTARNNRDIIYNTLRAMGEANNLMIARRLNWPINRVTPRMNELVKAGYVEESYRDKCPYTGKTTIFWRPKHG